MHSGEQGTFDISVSQDRKQEKRTWEITKRKHIKTLVDVSGIYDMIEIYMASLELLICF